MPSTRRCSRRLTTRSMPSRHLDLLTAVRSIHVEDLDMNDLHPEKVQGTCPGCDVDFECHGVSFFVEGGVYSESSTRREARAHHATQMVLRRWCPECKLTPSSKKKHAISCLVFWPRMGGDRKGILSQFFQAGKGFEKSQMWCVRLRHMWGVQDIFLAIRFIVTGFIRSLRSIIYLSTRSRSPLCDLIL